VKVGIVTFIRAYNHGAVLQSYALQKVLNDMGVDTEVIDYYPRHFYDTYHIATLSGIRYLPYRPLKNWIKYTPMLFLLNSRIKKFENFINKWIPLSNKQYTSFDEINNDELPYDAYISGSDQVWHRFFSNFDPVFFLCFNSANKARKFSYAASFGMKDIPEEVYQEYQNRLKGWEQYSVREKQGITLLKYLTGKTAVQSCDPTLLLSRKDWEKIINRKKVHKPYILVYYVNSSRKVFETAEKISKEKNMQIVSITSISSYEDIVGTESKLHKAKHIGDCAPDGFVSLFANAEYVVTDSFHGTVFSLLFHKNFLVDDRKGQNSRVFELLQYCDLCDRCEIDNVNSMGRDIAWSLVDEKLVEYKQSSLKYLQSIVEKISSEEINK